jgi:DNA-binding transcriptional LysR family regulator
LLVRALRAGSVDLAVLASAPPFRPPDAESPPLEVQVLAERSLCLAVPATHPLARQDAADVADLRGQRWIASPSAGEENLMGVWPGLDERPEIVHTARDWLAKLHLVAAGCGLTTVPASLALAAPPGVRVLAVRGGPAERRRSFRVRRPSRPPVWPMPCAPPRPTSHRHSSGEAACASEENAGPAWMHDVIVTRAYQTPRCLLFPE